MLPYRETRISTVLLTIFFLIVLGYAYFEARALLFGPSISLPTTQIVVHDPLILVKGVAENIASLSMNGKQISVAENGAFEEPYVLYVGYNRISLSAVDKYGSEKNSMLEVIYEPLVIAPVTPTPTLAPKP